MILLLSVVLTMQHGNTFCWIYTETYRDTGYTLEKRPRYTKLMVNVYYVLIISGRFKWCVGYICTRLKTKIRNIDGKYSQLQNIKIIQITPFYPKHIFFNIQTKDQVTVNMIQMGNIIKIQSKNHPNQQPFSFLLRIYLTVKLCQNAQMSTCPQKSVPKGVGLTPQGSLDLKPKFD